MILCHTGESLTEPLELESGSGAILTTGDLGLDGGVVTVPGSGGHRLLAPLPAGADGPGAPLLLPLLPLLSLPFPLPLPVP